MVSPSKKRKIDSRIQAKPSSAAVRTSTVTGDCRLRNSKKPLAEKKFYLDLKNHGAAVRIESRLKCLGARVEAFLAKEVSYVVTDRPEWSANVGGSQQQRQQGSSQWLASPLQNSASPATTDCPADSLTGKRKLLQRSRAEAMLEKAKQQHTHLNTIDPLENALRWGVSIWPLEKALKLLDKIENSLRNKSNQIPLKTRSLKAPFIKFEDISKKYRPVYSSFGLWPTINLDCQDCISPFSISKSPVKQEVKSPRNAAQAMLEQPQCDQRMTRKTRVQPLRNEEPVKTKLHAGYCELCAADYLDFDQHLNSSSHIKFVQDNKNYTDLDSLIKEGPTVEELLKAIDPIGCSTRKSPRGPASPPWAASDSVSDSVDSGDIMRRPALSNGQLRRTSQRQAEDRIKALARKDSCEVFMNGTAKKPSCKLGDGRFVEDERNCVEITHNLRSRLAPVDDAGFRRLRSRNSEGSVSVEGSSDSRDSSNEVDAHCSTKSKTEPARTRRGRNSSGSESNLRVKRDHEVHNADTTNGKQGSYSEEDTIHSLPGTKCTRVKGKIIKRKRLSVEEKLLEDNKEYYKLEVINAKLRSSGYFCNQRESNAPEDLHTLGHANDDSDQEASSRAKRPRRSELSRLNDEADNYLFGDKSIKKEANSPTYQNPNRSPLQLHIYADECANHVPSAPIGERSALSGIKEEAMSPRLHDDACHSGPHCSQVDPERKKRRSQAEAFIHENLEFYKFPLSESRLRFHSASTPHSPDKTETDGGCSSKYNAAPSSSRDINSTEHIPETRFENHVSSKSNLNTFTSFMSKVTTEAVEKMRFSFESIPRSEPWFQTYVRQDEGEEMVEPYSDFLFERRVKLPYETATHFYSHKFVRGRGMRGRGRGQVRGRLKILPRSRAMQLVAQARLPRKSPRCHASTLAILSSFGSRRRRSLGLPPDLNSVPVTVTATECVSDFQEIEKKVEEMLASPPASPVQDSSAKPLGRVRRRSQRRAVEGSKEALDVSDHEPLLDAEPIDGDNPVCNVAEVGLKSSSEVDVVNLVGEFPKCQCIDELQCEMQQNIEDECAALRIDIESECTTSTYDTVSEAGTYSSVRGKYKKRKTNKTGWPSAKKQKKKKLEVEPTENFVGVRIKRTPIKTCGEIRMEYRATSYRGRGKRGIGSNRNSTSQSSRSRANADQEDSPEKPSHSSSRGAVAGTSRDVSDESRTRSYHSSQSSPRVKDSPRKSQTRSTRWGSFSLRQRR